MIEILLIEDNLNDAELTIRALKKNNIANNIIHLKDGEVALDYLFATGLYADRDTIDRPKVILLDIKMPKVSGLEVLQKIKSNIHTKIIPVVMLTSSKEHPDIETAYQMGANSYIVKPVDFESFRKTINELGIYWMLINNSL